MRSKNSWWDESGGKGAKPDDLLSTLWTHNVEKENRLPYVAFPAQDCTVACTPKLKNK